MATVFTRLLATFLAARDVFGGLCFTFDNQELYATKNNLANCDQWGCLGCEAPPVLRESVALRSENSLVLDYFFLNSYSHDLIKVSDVIKSQSSDDASSRLQFGNHFAMRAGINYTMTTTLQVEGGTICNIDDMSCVSDFNSSSFTSEAIYIGDCSPCAVQHSVERRESSPEPDVETGVPFRAPPLHTIQEEHRYRNELYEPRVYTDEIKSHPGHFTVYFKSAAEGNFIIDGLQNAKTLYRATKSTHVDLALNEHVMDLDVTFSVCDLDVLTYDQAHCARTRPQLRKITSMRPIYGWDWFNPAFLGIMVERGSTLWVIFLCVSYTCLAAVIVVPFIRCCFGRCTCRTPRRVVIRSLVRGSKAEDLERRGYRPDQVASHATEIVEERGGILNWLVAAWLGTSYVRAGLVPDYDLSQVRYVPSSSGTGDITGAFGRFDDLFSNNVNLVNDPIPARQSQSFLCDQLAVGRSCRFRGVFDHTLSTSRRGCRVTEITRSSLGESEAGNAVGPIISLCVYDFWDTYVVEDVYHSALLSFENTCARTCAENYKKCFGSSGPTDWKYNGHDSFSAVHSSCPGYVVSDGTPGGIAHGCFSVNTAYRCCKVIAKPTKRYRVAGLSGADRRYHFIIRVDMPSRGVRTDGLVYDTYFMEHVTGANPSGGVQVSSNGEYYRLNDPNSPAGDGAPEFEFGFRGSYAYSHWDMNDGERLILVDQEATRIANAAGVNEGNAGGLGWVKNNGPIYDCNHITGSSFYPSYIPQFQDTLWQSRNLIAPAQSDPSFMGETLTSRLANVGDIAKWDERELIVSPFSGPGIESYFTMLGSWSLMEFEAQPCPVVTYVSQVGCVNCDSALELTFSGSSECGDGVSFITMTGAASLHGVRQVALTDEKRTFALTVRSALRTNSLSFHFSGRVPVTVVASFEADWRDPIQDRNATNVTNSFSDDTKSWHMLAFPGTHGLFDDIINGAAYVGVAVGTVAVVVVVVVVVKKANNIRKKVV